MRTVVLAALGNTGYLASSFDDLRLAADAQGETEAPCMVFCGASETKATLKREVPPGCEVWTRKQLVSAIVQQTFNHQKPYMSS